MTTSRPGQRETAGPGIAAQPTRRRPTTRLSESSAVGGVLVAATESLAGLVPDGAALALDTVAR
jgi:hypothetical protein